MCCPPAMKGDGRSQTICWTFLFVSESHFGVKEEPCIASELVIGTKECTE